MHQRNKIQKIAIITAALVIAMFLPYAAANVSVNYSNIPKIDQWANSSLPIGTYSNLTRISGIWYENGSAFAYSTTPTPETPNAPPSSDNSPKPSSTQKTTLVPTDIVHPTTIPAIPESPLLFYFAIAIVYLFAIGAFAVVQASKKDNREK